MVTPGSTGLGWAPGGWVVDPYTGLAVWQRGGYQWVMTPGTVVNQVNRVYQPTYTPVQVAETTMVNRVVTQKVPVQTVRYVDEQVVQQVPVQSMKMVAETAVRQVPVQTVRKVVERVENKVPVTVCKMVPEEQVRQVAVQVCKFVSEEKVEPVQVQVCKYVAEERTVQVPRTVEKREPYTYTVRTPRTVVMKVPLDPCGNPLPAATVAPAAAPQSTAPSLKPTEAGPLKTFSDKPADASAPAAEGWTKSSLDHVEPSRSGAAETRRAEKPAADATPAEALRRAEPIPTPAAKEPAAASAAAPQEGNLPAAGPTVEPPPPSHDLRDVPAATTSGNGRGLTSIPSGHST